MTPRRLSKDGSVHVTDEIFNTVSHMAGAILALAGWVVLVVQASMTKDVWRIVSFSIYGFSLFALFLSSTLHHGVDGPEHIERRLRVFDYNAIFLLIAGSFTPIALVLLRSPLAWSLLGVCWLLAVVGITMKSTWPHLPKWVTSTLYLGMAWMALPLLGAMIPALGPRGMLLLVLGGLFYLGGVVIYSAERPNPLPGRFGFHEIWHVMVLGGAASHFLMMWWVVLPPR